MSLERYSAPEIKEVPPIPFSDLRLDQIELYPTPGDHFHNYTHRNGTISERLRGMATVIYEDMPLNISVTNDRESAPNKGPEAESFTVILGKDGAVIKMILEFTYETNNKGAVDVQIIRQDPDNILPKGLGILAYQKLLDLIANIAKTKDMPITDQVSMVLNYSDTPLTPERWESIFVPVLDERGYTRIDKSHWEKTYLPEE